MLKNDKAAIIESIYSSELSSELFSRFTLFIKHNCGIHIIPSKKTMLEGRLRKRMRQLLLPTFEDYARYLFNTNKHDSSEMVHFLDVVTTNKTGFFRETPHFDYLVSKILPEFMNRDNRRLVTFRIWSAGCSSGQEPYSLAILLNEFAEKNPAFRYAILATDLSRCILDTAKAGVYDTNQLDDVTPEHRDKYFVAVRNNSQLRITEALRKTIMFKRLNLMNGAFPIKEPLHAIFCRNVMMYFDRDDRKKLVRRFTEQLAPGGYLFTGHSESLAGLSSELHSASNSVYRKPLP